MLPQSLRARYHLLRELGSGGYGRVLLAEDRELSRPVAIKLLESLIDDPHLVERFQLEAKVTSQIEHPNVVRVYEHGVASDQTPFMVFEYIEGEDLASRIEDHRPLSQEEAKAWAIQLSEALHQAHRAGVIHRDIKPANILERDGSPVLCDFGIARLEGDAGKTKKGLVLGTPSYVSPEIWAGKAPSPASDQYALAATLFEGLYLRRSQPEEDPKKIWKMLREDWRPKIPSSRIGEAPLLEKCLLKALENAPEDRFASLDEFSRVLQKKLPFPKSKPRAPNPLTTQSVKRLKTQELNLPGRGRSFFWVGLGILGVVLAFVFLPRAPTVLPPPREPALVSTSLDAEDEDQTKDLARSLGQLEKIYPDPDAIPSLWNATRLAMQRVEFFLDDRLPLQLQRLYRTLPWTQEDPSWNEESLEISRRTLFFLVRFFADLERLERIAFRALNPFDVDGINEGPDLPRLRARILEIETDRSEKLSLAGIPDELRKDSLAWTLRAILRSSQEGATPAEAEELFRGLTPAISRERDPRRLVYAILAGNSMSEQWVAWDELCPWREDFLRTSYERLIPAPPEPIQGLLLESLLARLLRQEIFHQLRCPKDDSPGTRRRQELFRHLFESQALTQEQRQSLFQHCRIAFQMRRSLATLPPDLELLRTRLDQALEGAPADTPTAFPRAP